MRVHLPLGCVILVCSAGAFAAGPQTPLQACYASSSDRIAVGHCLERKLQEAEKGMDEALIAARQEMARLDSASGRPQGAKALAAAQEKFLQFRKTNCAWHAAQMGSGTGSGDAAQDCRIRMTLGRAEELHPQTSTAAVRAPPEPPAESASVMAWQGVEWKLRKMVREGKEVPLVVGSKVTANFHAAGRVAGMASVNRYLGNYKVTGEGRIDWSAPAFGATRMAGPPELMQQEGRFLDALGKVSRARMEDSRLVLVNDDGSIELTFER